MRADARDSAAPPADPGSLVPVMSRGAPTTGVIVGSGHPAASPIAGPRGRRGEQRRLQSAKTGVFWLAVSNQRPSSLDITYIGVPSLSKAPSGVK